MKTNTLCIILALCVMSMFIPAAGEFCSVWSERSAVQTKYELADVPLLTLQELQAEAERVRLLAYEHAGDNPRKYFEVTEEVFGLEEKINKYGACNREYDPVLKHLRIRVSQDTQHLSMLQDEYRLKFGQKALGEAAENYVYTQRPFASRTKVNVPEGEMSSYASVWPPFQAACLLSLIPMFLINIIRIKNAGLLLWPELFTRLIPATVAWPITCLFYPTRVIKEEQIMLGLRVASYALSAVLSFAGVSGATGSQAKKKSKEKDSNDAVQTIEKDFSLNIEGYPLTGSGSGHYIGPDYSWSYGPISGFGFAEIGDTPFFSLHSVDADAPGPVDLTFEQGYGPMGYFARIGPKVKLNSTPIGKVTSKVFKSITCSHIFRVVNKEAPVQSAITWETRSIDVGRFKLLSEGFYRLSYNRPDLAQPQIWLQSGRWKFGLELSYYGGNLNPLFGAMISF